MRLSLMKRIYEEKITMICSPTSQICKAIEMRFTYKTAAYELVYVVVGTQFLANDNC